MSLRNWTAHFPVTVDLNSVADQPSLHLEVQSLKKTDGWTCLYEGEAILHDALQHL